jgi:hypothetical protein
MRPILSSTPPRTQIAATRPVPRTNSKPKFLIKHINDKDNGKSKGDSYMKNIKNNTFHLHFHEKHETNARNLNKGDIILLFQKDKNEKRIFTHLVSPTDNTTHKKYPHLFQSDKNALVYWRKVKIIKQKTTAFLSTRFWRKVKFRGISFGNACEIKSISAVKNGSVSLKDLINEMWDMFGVNQNKRSFP